MLGGDGGRKVYRVDGERWTGGRKRAGMQVHEAHEGEGVGLMIISSATERCIQVRSKNVNTTLQLGIVGDVSKMCFSTTGLEAGAEEGMIIE